MLGSRLLRALRRAAWADRVPCSPRKRPRFWRRPRPMASWRVRASGAVVAGALGTPPRNGLWPPGTWLQLAQRYSAASEVRRKVMRICKFDANRDGFAASFVFSHKAVGGPWRWWGVRSLTLAGL